jgi:hypothetical protein
MVWLAVDKNGDESVHDMEPTRNNEYMWWSAWDDDGSTIELPKGSIKHLIGRELTWADEPFEFTEVVG